MEQRTLGSGPLAVSAIGLGGNNFGRTGTRTETLEGTRAVLDAARESGVTLIDTADIYGGFGRSEELIGQALGGHRDAFVIATKFGHADFAPDLADGAAKGSRAYIRAAVEGSLIRLGIDTIDLYQQHTPDPATPVEETLAALDELVVEGKVRAIGSSNYDAGMLAHADEVAAATGGARFVTAQNEWNLLTRGIEAEILPTAARLGVAILPFFPLANGLFTGKFSRTERPADSRIARQRPHVADEAPWDAIEAFAAFCAERGIGLLEGTLGWFLAHPATGSVIAGATGPEQVRGNAVAGMAWRPDAAELAAIDGFFPVG